MLGRLRTSCTPALIALIAVLALPGSAQAYRQATQGEAHAIARKLLPRSLPYDRGGRLAWAEVSTAGPYAVAYVVARRHNTKFQNALDLLRRHRHRWVNWVDIIHESCYGVPPRVLLDFRHFFGAHERGLLTPGARGYYGCAAKIAYAR